MFERPLDPWPEIFNYNERIVLDQLDEYGDQGMIPCQCRECLLDIIALSLNRLKPRYTVSLLQKFYDTHEAERALRTEIKAAVDWALDKVGRHPQH